MLVSNHDSSDGRAEERDMDQIVPAAITDTGCERDLNEDRYAVVECASGIAWIVCDGMGGVTGGELAAQLAIDAMRRDLENHPRRSIESALRGSIIESNRVIVLRRQNPAFSGMGTTVVAAAFSGSEVVIGNVGDSRAYLIRDCAIQQLTTDHTLVQEMVDRGQIKAEDALSHPQAHILTRCIGSETGLDVSIKKFWVWEVAPEEPSDYLLLCSDGLYSHVADAEIAMAVTRNSPQRACVDLVELTKSRGGFDNITITVIPLAGQLKKEPPIGYNPNAHLQIATGGESEGVRARLFSLFVISAICSLIAVFVTVLIVAVTI